MSILKIGDRVTVAGYPPGYPLVVLVVCGGRVAIGSPRWPRGTGYPVEFHQITSVNGGLVQFEAIAQTKRRKAA
jgi:hypothetical protein